MTTKNLIERVLILAILFVAILQLGGTTVLADLACGVAGQGTEVHSAEFAERCCRVMGFPHSNAEACRLLMVASSRH